MSEEPERIHFPWQANYRPDRRDYEQLQREQWDDVRRTWSASFQDRLNKPRDEKEEQDFTVELKPEDMYAVPGLWYLGGIVGLLVLGMLIIRIMMG